MCKRGYPRIVPDGNGQFHDLWDSTVKPKDRDKYGWNANPLVWVIEFEKVEIEKRG